VKDDLMPIETTRSVAGSPGYLAEHSPLMLALLDRTEQPTAHAKQVIRPLAIRAYRKACSKLVERILDDTAPAGAVEYWRNARDGLMKKFQFTEVEITNG
jgi:hypothetical protein